MQPSTVAFNSIQHNINGCTGIVHSYTTNNGFHRVHLTDPWLVNGFNHSHIFIRHRSRAHASICCYPHDLHHILLFNCPSIFLSISYFQINRFKIQSLCKFSIAYLFLKSKRTLRSGERPFYIVFVHEHHRFYTYAHKRQNDNFLHNMKLTISIINFLIHMIHLPITFNTGQISTHLDLKWLTCMISHHFDLLEINVDWRIRNRFLKFGVPVLSGYFTEVPQC